MGLDTSHDCWHGAYSAFMTWRRYLAEIAGYPPLDLMKGFFYRDGHGAISLVTSAVKDRYGDTKYLDDILRGTPISWKYFEKDPLTVLLYHSDCDGDIEHKDCLPLANRLKELLEEMPEDKNFSGHIGNVREKTQQFIDGLMMAHNNGENVGFH